MKKIIKKIKEFLGKFEPKTQRNIIIGVVLLILMGGFFLLSPEKKPQRKVESGIKEYNFEDEGIDNAFNYKMLDETARLNEELEKLKEEKLHLQQEKNKIEKEKYKIEKEAFKNPEEKINHFANLGKEDEKEEKLPFPVPPAQQKQESIKSPNTIKEKIFNQFGDNAPPPQKVELIMEGGIVSNPLTDEELKEASKKEEAENEKKKSIYLPPSFVKANLLTGIVASTVNKGQGDTSPMMLRIQDLAVLPNNVKANLKGCFLIGEGSGNIATERVKARLTTLSCVDLKGNAVIEESVNGWIVDADGKVGLKGRVVAKMGAHLLRTFWAEFVGGFGSGIADSTKDFSFTDTGNVNALMSDDDIKGGFKSGFGEGLEAAAKSLKNFYLDLAEQTMPVIEVGATKDVTVVFSQGTELKIQEKMLEGMSL
jgi:conjugal transfer pilus assembly protein TraB